MFGATTSDYTDALPRIDCIKQFHDLPYYTSSDLYSVYHQILEDIQVLKTTSVYLHYTGSYNLSSGSLDVVPTVGINTSSSDSDLDLFSGPIPVKGGVKTISIQTTNKNSNIEIVKSLPIKSKKETLGNNCACTNTQNRGKISIENFQDETEDNPTYAEIIDWSEFVGNNEGDFEIDIFWDNYKQSKSRSSGNTYKEKLELARVENNPMKRTSLFVCAFINKLGRRPSVDEAEDEYVAQGLNRNSQSSTLNRRKRIKGSIEYYFKEYDESKTGFKLNWDEEKTRVLSLIKPYLPKNLSYRQGTRTQSISPEHIGFVYNVICRMENSDQSVILRNSLSYSQADDLFLSEFGKKCGRHKFSGIIKILLSCVLIEKVANYKAGLRGNCYVASQVA